MDTESAARNVVAEALNRNHIRDGQHHRGIERNIALEAEVSQSLYQAANSGGAHDTTGVSGLILENECVRIRNGLLYLVQDWDL
jgi:hypothetical protein